MSPRPYPSSMMRTLLGSLLLPVLLALGCARSAPEDAASDGAGERIVVLSPALAVILSDMGLESRIVGRHAYDRVLDPAVPVCGDQQAINYEALLRARPSHVLTQWGSRGLPEKLTGLAGREGFVVRDFRLLTLEDIDGAVGALLDMFPDATPDESVARFRSLAAGPAPEPVWEGRVLLLMGVSPISALGPGSAHDELLRRVGGVPAIAEGAPAMTLHAEDVLRLAPDAVVLIQSGAGAGVEDRLGRAIMGLDIPAVREGRLLLLDDPLALVPSTRLEAVATRMRRALEAWRDR